MIRALSGPPRAPTKIGPSGGSVCGHIATYSWISVSTFCSPGPMRVLLPLPVTTSTAPAPGKGTSRRFSPSASEMRKPDPYNSAITAASRAQIQGSRASPARSSASVKRFAAAIWIGFGRVFPTLGARIADRAPTLPLPSCSRKRPNERKPASARIRERPHGGGLKRCKARKRHLRAPVLPEKDETLADVAGIGLERLRRQPSLSAQMRQPTRHFQRDTVVGAGEFNSLNSGSWLGHGALGRRDDSWGFYAPS